MGFTSIRNERFRGPGGKRQAPPVQKKSSIFLNYHYWFRSMTSNLGFLHGSWCVRMGFTSIRNERLLQTRGSTQAPPVPKSRFSFELT